LILWLATSVALLVATLRDGKEISLVFSTFDIAVPAAVVVLAIMGVAAGIGNNVGRILAILTPLVAVLCIRNVRTLLSGAAMR
jgi:uncharacterized membrane protein